MKILVWGYHSFPLSYLLIYSWSKLKCMGRKGMCSSSIPKTVYTECPRFVPSEVIPSKIMERLKFALLPFSRESFDNFFFFHILLRMTFRRSIILHVEVTCSWSPLQIPLSYLKVFIKLPLQPVQWGSLIVAHRQKPPSTEPLLATCQCPVISSTALTCK